MTPRLPGPVQARREPGGRHTACACYARRRGAAILIVLVVISVAFALSYAVMRSQGTSVLIQHNAALGASAREAAMTGLTVALKEMSTDDWAGVDTTLARSLGSRQRFEVTYTTGDPSLKTGDDDYVEWPYRVTLLSTGYATDLTTNPERVVSYRMQAVVRLVPRKLADEPRGWSDLTDHALCQWAIGTFAVNAPFRVKGTVRVRGVLDFSKSQMSWSDNVRQQYFEDLNRMRQAGKPDWRPFTGPVKMYTWWQYPDTRQLLNSAMDVATSYASFATDFQAPSSPHPERYRLYPGGKQYTAQELAGDVQNRALEPDPKTNPLGIYVCSGQSRIRDNVTVRGTLLAIGGSGALVTIEGANVRFEPPTHAPPPLVGGSVPIRLPAVASTGSIVVGRGAQATVQGMLVAGKGFQVESDEQDKISLEVQGRVAAKNIQIGVRTGWDKDRSWWQNRLSDFSDQLLRPGAIHYFPEWLLKDKGLDSTPRVTIEPPTDEICYHCYIPDDPLYVPHPDDATELDPRHPGLRWELIQWTDNL